MTFLILIAAFWFLALACIFNGRARKWAKRRTR